MTRKTTPEEEAHADQRPERHPEDARAGQSATPDPSQGATNEVNTAGDAQLRRENTELKDRLLRALAEVENTRRRAERDLNDMRQYAVTRFAGDMLPVADNLERAIASIPTHARDGERAVKTLIEGVELTEKELQRSLAKHDINKLEPMGKRFDPNFHEAMFEVPDATLPSGTIVKVVEAGYSIGSRALRPAKVGVATGEPRGGRRQDLDEPEN